MSNQELGPDCGRIRNELAAYLSGELAAESIAAVVHHLAGCAGCRDGRAGLRETRRLLARWETPRASEDPRQLAHVIAAQARAEVPPAPRARPRARLVRWSAILSGAAAAVLFTLGVLNTEASYTGGGFQVRFRLPGSSAASAAWDEERLRTIAAQEVTLQTAGMKRDQQESLQHCSQMSREELQQELLRVTRALDAVLEQRERTWDSRLANFGQEAARADLEQRRAITDLIELVSNR